MVTVNSDAMLNWFYDYKADQQVISGEFGVMVSSTRVKLFDMQLSGSGSAFPITPWPSTFAWYQNRISWAGDLTSKRITFKIINSTLEDSNKFYCVVYWKNPADTKFNVINLLIIASPVVIKPIASSYYIEGNQVNVTCNTTGVPTPSVHWIRVIDDYKYQSFTGVSYLRFDSVNKEDAGQYKCIATNSAGTDEETVDIVVYYKPEIIVNETNSTVGSWNRKDLTLQCVAKGEPPAEFQWFKPDGQQITANILTIKDGSTVTIQTTAPGEYGEYICRANNTAGFNEHYINVTQWVEPSEPNITDPDIEASSITLRWTPPSNNGGSQVIDYKVIVKDDDQQRNPLSVNGTQILIVNLKPGQSYTFVLSARNVVGFGRSVSRTFQTKFKGKPGTSAVQNTETEISSKQITLTWSAAPENGAKILTYTVWWRQIDITGGTGVWSSHNTSSDALLFTVTWLEFGKTYDFGVTAWNSYGEGARDDENGLKRIKVLPKSTETPPSKEPERSTGVNAAAIGGGAAAAVVIILVVIIVIVIIKRKKSPKKAGESRDPLGSNGDEGYSSVSKASAARRLGRNNAANDDAGIPTYATVDKSKKTPKKPDLIYAELADFNETPEARAASMKRHNQPSSYVPTDYAEITQFGRPKEEPMYDNVPRY